jgi:8-oxo-dGTP diphosphatase
LNRPIAVVAAVVQEEGRYLLCQRHDGPHLPLKWEFPGGKIEAGETSAEALCREIAEELGTSCDVGRELAELTHSYPEKTVSIRFFAARLEGVPQPVVHRALEWIHPDRFHLYAAPPPNAIILTRIQSGEFAARPARAT